MCQKPATPALIANHERACLDEGVKTYLLYEQQIDRNQIRPPDVEKVQEGQRPYL